MPPPPFSLYHLNETIYTLTTTRSISSAQIVIEDSTISNAKEVPEPLFSKPTWSATWVKGSPEKIEIETISPTKCCAGVDLREQSKAEPSGTSADYGDHRTRSDRISALVDELQLDQNPPTKQ